MYICINNTLYTCFNKYNFNFSKMAIDTKLKFSRAIQKYINYICSLKLYNLYMFKICRHILFLSIFSKNIIDTKLKFSVYT